MEYIIVVLALLLIVSLIFAYGEYTDNKELESEIDDYQFCYDCISKLNHEDVYAVLVYESKINTSRRLILTGMGYKLSDEMEIPVARLPQMIRIEPIISKIPNISIKECSQYPG